MARSTTANALTQEAAGLTYQSETDSSWKVFRWPNAKGEPTPERVRQTGRHRPDSPVEEQTIDDFFAPLVQEQDWYGDAEKVATARYRALRDTVKQSLRNPKVVKVGERKVAVYVVGIDPEGGWSGLKTTAVET